MRKKLPPINILRTSVSKLENEGANSSRTFLTSPQKVNSRYRSKSQAQSARKPKVFQNDHPIFLYLDPAINEFATFSAVMRDFAAKNSIEQTNQQLLYQFGHVQTSFTAFTNQAKLNFNKAWQVGSKPIASLTTGALYRSGKELVENWIDLVRLSNQSLDLGVLPLLKLLYKHMTELLNTFNSAYRAVKVYSVEDTMFIHGKKNLTEKIVNFRRKVMIYVMKDTPPPPSFNAEEFSQECKNITQPLSRFIIPIPPSLSMKSAEILREKTRLSFIISEINNLCDSITDFKKVSTSVKISLFHTNEVLCDLMEKLDFPFEFHIKFDKIANEEEKRMPKKEFDSTHESVNNQLNEISDMIHNDTNNSKEQTPEQKTEPPKEEAPKPTEEQPQERPKVQTRARRRVQVNAPIPMPTPPPPDDLQSTPAPQPTVQSAPQPQAETPQTEQSQPQTEEQPQERPKVQTRARRRVQVNAPIPMPTPQPQIPPEPIQSTPEQTIPQPEPSVQQRESHPHIQFAPPPPDLLQETAQTTPTNNPQETTEEQPPPPPKVRTRARR